MPLPGFLGAMPDRERIIERCRWLGALTPYSARSEPELNTDHSAVWDELRMKGWIRDAGGGSFYLDMRRMPRRGAHRGSWRLIAFLIGVVMLSLSLR